MKTNYRLPVYCGIATYNGKGREASVKKAIESLEHQVDGIFLYDNEKESYNATDNGKFWGLTQITEPCYYLTCDDDLLYPPTYVKDLIGKIEEYQCICSHHGRILTREGVSYYRGHKSFRCLNDIVKDELIDVPGTGVTGFSTEYFNPIHLWQAEDLKMSDLVFALEATKQNKNIMVLKHLTGYIKHLDINLKDTIWAQEQQNPRQNQIADQIYKIKH